jgi:hypothetical protein
MSVRCEYRIPRHCEQDAGFVVGVRNGTEFACPEHLHRVIRRLAALPDGTNRTVRVGVIRGDSEAIRHLARKVSDAVQQQQRAAAAAVPNDGHPDEGRGGLVV